MKNSKCKTNFANLGASGLPAHIPFMQIPKSEICWCSYPTLSCSTMIKNAEILEVPPAPFIV